MARSWWGWGNVEDAVAGAERAGLTQRLAAVFPEADLTVHEPPKVEELAVPAPRIQAPDALAELASQDLEDRVAHGHGQAFRDVVRCLLGRVDNVPDLVLRPRREQDVVDVLEWCANAGIALIPFGGGTSVVGGVEPRGLGGSGEYAGAV
ncbi:FAD-binding protein, partial [Streptacidiphilus anmyonensis]|uniref:FAD-binding protein n=1 Tax=Streptacidiphilus anmyonensis TaxID=405782 RepID=UPI0005A8F2B6